MKPWEETWRASSANDLHVAGDERMVANFYDHKAHTEARRGGGGTREKAYELDDARIKLAAQAPAMARLLLAIHNQRRASWAQHERSGLEDVLRAAGVLR